MPFENVTPENSPLAGFILCRRLQKALGIPLTGQHVRRIVIDCDVKKAVLVYVERFLTKEHACEVERVLTEACAANTPEVVEAREINVDEHGMIHYERVAHRNPDLVTELAVALQGLELAAWQFCDSKWPVMQQVAAALERWRKESGR